MLPRLNHLGYFEKMLFRGVGFQSVGLNFGGVNEGKETHHRGGSQVPLKSLRIKSTFDVFLLRVSFNLDLLVGWLEKVETYSPNGGETW